MAVSWYFHVQGQPQTGSCSKHRLTGDRQPRAQPPRHHSPATYSAGGKSGKSGLEAGAGRWLSNYGLRTVFSTGDWTYCTNTPVQVFPFRFQTAIASKSRDRVNSIRQEEVSEEEHAVTNLHGVPHRTAFVHPDNNPRGNSQPVGNRLIDKSPSPVHR